jgi:hypothetical protein
MSDLKYINEPGAGEKHSDLGHYSQAVVIGNIAKLSGQGGWDNEGNLEQYDAHQQIDNAFDNVDRVLRAAGLRGWEDVRFWRLFLVEILSPLSRADLENLRAGLPPPKLPSRYRHALAVPRRQTQGAHSRPPPALDRAQRTATRVPRHVGRARSRGYQEGVGVGGSMLYAGPCATLPSRTRQLWRLSLQHGDGRRPRVQRRSNICSNI